MEGPPPTSHRFRGTACTGVHMQVTTVLGNIMLNFAFQAQAVVQFPWCLGPGRGIQHLLFLWPPHAQVPSLEWRGNL